MPRQTSALRNLQIEWNSLVPQGRALGLPRVRTWTTIPPSIWEGEARLNWLRDQLAAHTSQIALTTEIAAQFTFGIEIECILPRGFTHADLAAALVEAGVEAAAETYNHTVRSGWKLVTDGSLSDYIRGCELVSPILTGEEGIANARKVCAVLVAKRVKVNRSCGLHVHIGAANESLDFFKNLVALYARYQTTIDTVMSPSRRANNNAYARPVQFGSAARNASSLDALRRATGRGALQARYHKLNLEAFWRHGTVEFRHHQGTVEADKVEYWVRFCLRLAGVAKENNLPAAQPRSLNGLLNLLKATDAERNYFEGRQAHFNAPLVDEESETIGIAGD